MRRITIEQRWNADKSVTFFYRIPKTEGGASIEKCMRTGPGLRKGSREHRRALTQAREMAAVRCANALAQQPINPITPRALRQALDEYIGWATDIGPDGKPRYARGTVENQERHIRNLLDFLRHWEPPVQYVHEIPRAALAAWRDALIRADHAGNTINSMISSISTWCAWSIDHGYCHVAPTALLLRCKTGGNGRPQSRLTQPEVMREHLGHVLAQLPRERADAALLLATTGMRSTEMRTLPRDAVDLERAEINVPRQSTERTKRHERTIPLCPQALEAAQRLVADSTGPYLIGWSSGAKPYTSSLNNWLEPLHVKPHDLRKFFYTALKTIEAPQDVIDSLMGHAPNKLDETYGGEQPEKLRRWIARLGEWLSASANSRMS